MPNRHFEFTFIYKNNLSKFTYQSTNDIYNKDLKKIWVYIAEIKSILTFIDIVFYVNKKCDIGERNPKSFLEALIKLIVKENTILYNNTDHSKIITNLAELISNQELIESLEIGYLNIKIISEKNQIRKYENEIKNSNKKIEKLNKRIEELTSKSISRKYGKQLL